MIPIGSIGGQIEVSLDLPVDRVALIVLATGWVIWLTDTESDRLAEVMAQAARESRRRREEARGGK